MAYIGNEYSSYTRAGKNYKEDINFFQINFSYGLSKGSEDIPVMKTDKVVYEKY